MELVSDAFEPGQPIPIKYTKQGQDLSPPLRWSDVPKEAREIALTFENRSEPWVQWIVYGIPSDLDGLPEGFRHQREPAEPMRVLQGTNSRGNVGYDGPLGTESRKYRYVFHLYALDEPLDVPAGLTKDELERAMRGHVLDEAQLEVTFVRPRD